MGFLDSLPTLGDMPRRAVQKGVEPSRLQTKTAKATDERKDEERWKKAVWKRDECQCRWCRRKVRKCLELAPDRGECHHISGHIVKEIRWDRRKGVLLCAACHERVTGKVAEKHVIVAKHTFTADEIAYINGDKPLQFKRV